MDLTARLRMIATLGQGVARGLPDAARDRDPLELLEEWYEAARSAGILLPEAFSLATATATGIPSVRMILVKGFDERGIVFYTNYGSRKARELDENPVAAICFHWAVLQRQARVEGTVRRVTSEESDAYFRTRTRGSKIGAWASRQSETLESRSVLEERVKAKQREYGSDEVPRPEFWGGYVLAPLRIEFWQGRADRLHDRLLFERDSEGEPWVTRLLYP